MKITLFAAIALALVMAFFAIQNSQHTQVTFLGWYFNGPLVIVLLTTFGAGAVATFLAMLPGTVRKSVENSKLRTRVAEQAFKLEVLEKKQQDSKILE